MNVAGSSTSLTRGILAVALTLGLAASAGGLLSALDRQRTALVRAEQLAYLPKGEYLKLAVLGFRQFAADLIWLQAVQHIGARKDTHEGYSWTYHAVDVLTDLDPQFVHAYQATGLLLGVLVGHHDEGVAILTKGMRHNPEVWQLPFLVGYISYYERCDAVVGAQYLRIAAQIPGAPAYLPKFAARMTVESGDPDAALEFLDRFSRTVSDERLRDALALRTKEVVRERDLRLLEDGVRRYYAEYKRYPSRLQDLVARGIIQEIPSDPLGGLYQLDPATGIVSGSSQSERLRIHKQVACTLSTARGKKSSGPTSQGSPQAVTN